MRARFDVGVVVALLVTAATPAAATVDFFGSTTTCAGVAFNPGDSYPLFRGRTVTLTVSGFAVDNAKEVQLSSLPGVHATLKNRKHGLGSSVDIELSVDATAALSTGEIRLRYDVELAGFDKIPAQVFEYPRVDALSFHPAPGVSSVGTVTNLVPGFDYTLVLTGKSLLDLRPRSPFANGDRFTNVSVLDASDTTLKIGLRPVRVGTTALSTGNFQIERLRCIEKPTGSGAIDVSISVPPTPTTTPTPRPPPPDLHSPVFTPAGGLTLLPIKTPAPTSTPTPNQACLDQKARETAQLSADALRCGDTQACVQTRKNEQKAIEDRYQACLLRGGK